jgi:hypothetical protein
MYRPTTDDTYDELSTVILVLFQSKVPEALENHTNGGLTGCYSSYIEMSLLKFGRTEIEIQ